MPAPDIRSGFKKLMAGEGALKNTLRTGLAELLGTAILVFIGCMGCVSGLGVNPHHLQVTLTFGLAVMIVIQCVGHISSAHVNPAVTVGSVVLGKKSIPEALVYILFQILGGIIGFGMLKVVTPKGKMTLGGLDDPDTLCVTDLHADVAVIQGLLLEGIATGVLMLVVCSVWDARNARNSDSVAIKFGLTVAALATAFGPYTGCSMNPARSLGPALWNDQWGHHWVYWFGPIGGALLSSFMYRTVFGVKDQPQVTSLPESQALNSVEMQKNEQP